MALTPEQIEERRGRVTSSRVPAIMGLDPRKSPLKVALEMRGELDGEEVSNVKAIHRGNELEDIILSQPAKEFGLAWLRAPFRTLESNDALGDHTDALYFHSLPSPQPVAIGEGKSRPRSDRPRSTARRGPTRSQTTRSSKVTGTSSSGRCPSATCQSWSVATTSSFGTTRSSGTTTSVAHLVEECARFHRDYVVGSALPDADWRDQDLVRSLKKAKPESLLEVTTERVMLAVEKERWRQRKIACERREMTAKARLAVELGEHEAMRAKDAFGSVTFKASKPSLRVDWEGLAHAIAGEAGIPAELIADYTKTVTADRVLRVNPRRKVSAELELEAAAWLQRVADEAEEEDAA